MRSRKSHYNLPNKGARIASARKAEARRAQITKEFNQYHANFAAEYILSLIDDAHNNLHMLYGFADYTRDRRYVSRRIRHEGLDFVTNGLPTLMAGLLAFLEHGEPFYPNFKLRTGTEHPVFLRRMFEIVTNERNYSAEQQGAAIDVIYNVSTCFKKLRGPADENSHQQHYDDFVATDVELGRIDFDADLLQPIIRSLCTQWDSFVSDVSPFGADNVPRPGPGAVVGGVPKHMRYAPHVLYKTLNTAFPYEEWFYTHPWDLVQQSRLFLELNNAPEDEPHSEYLLVPKTFVKWRGICKEANEVQYIQQGLRRVLYNAIERKLNSFIPIRNQDVHRTLAQSASADREDATVDESEASDRIARLLVSYMVQNTPDWANALEAASSKLVKPPSWATQTEYLATNKFAPMGSAICFPIMSLVHFFLVRAVILIYCTDMTHMKRKALCNQVSVYGDDIVLPSSVVPLVYEWLPRFGMKINESKSFAKSFFRESCGCHAYKGVDITPVYIKYTNFESTEGSPAKKLASLLAAESNLFRRGKVRTAEFLRKYIETKWPNMPYVSDVTNLVGFLRPPFHEDLTDFSQLSKKATSRKWNRWLQTYTYRLNVWSSAVEEGIIPNDYQAYLQSLVQRPTRDVKFQWLATGEVSSPFSIDEFVRRVDDEALTLKVKRARIFSSGLEGHELKLDHSMPF